MLFFEEAVSYTHKNGDNVLPHSHSGYEAVLYTSGEGVVACGNEELKYTRNSLVIIPRAMRHYEHTELETKVLACVFDTDYFYIDSPVFIDGAKYGANLEKLETLMRGIYDASKAGERKAGGNDEKDELSAIAYLLAYLIELKKDENCKPYTLLIKNAKNYIYVNFKKKIDYAYLADTIGYSYERFRHIFTIIVGVSLKQYQLGVQLSHAKDLLINTPQCIKDVAKNCGFKTPEQFVNCFKIKTGVYPSEYRKISRLNPLDKTFNASEQI